MDQVSFQCLIKAQSLLPTSKNTRLKKMNKNDHKSCEILNRTLAKIL